MFSSLHIPMFQAYEIWLEDAGNPVLPTNQYEERTFILLPIDISIFGKQIVNNTITKILTKAVADIIPIFLPKLTYGKIFKSD